MPTIVTKNIVIETINVRPDSVLVIDAAGHGTVLPRDEDTSPRIEREELFAIVAWWARQNNIPKNQIEGRTITFSVSIA